jgi:putative peptidoglycan lipid II flippase
MSTHARDGDLGRVRADFRDSVSRIGVFMVLSAVGLIVIALPFARQFATSLDAVDAMALVIMLFVLGLVPFSVLFVIQRVFYALEDTRTPFFIQVVQALVFISLALVASGLPTDQIAYGLALSTTGASWVQCLLAFAVLRRKLGGLGTTVILVRFSAFLLASIPAAAAGLGLLLALGVERPGGFLLSSAPAAALGMVMITVAMTAVYAGVLILGKNSDMLAVWAPVARRLGIQNPGNSSA